MCKEPQALKWVKCHHQSDGTGIELKSSVSPAGGFPKLGAMALSF